MTIFELKIFLCAWAALAVGVGFQLGRTLKRCTPRRIDDFCYTNSGDWFPTVAETEAAFGEVPQVGKPNSPKGESN